MDWLFRYADPSTDWNYAIVTLLVRFVGVFVVMAVVQVALQVASRVIGRIEAQPPKPATEHVHPLVSLELSAMAEHESELDGAAMAAIALALVLDKQELVVSGRPSGVAPAASGPSAWALAGRMRSLR